MSNLLVHAGPEMNMMIRAQVFDMLSAVFLKGGFSVYLFFRLMILLDFLIKQNDALVSE